MIIIELYHGTTESSAIDIINNGINLDKSMPYLDFGKGFYLTDNYTLAVERARAKTIQARKRFKSKDNMAVIIVEYTENQKLSIKKFDYQKPNDDWAKFVIANRLPLDFIKKNYILEHNLDNRYDIVSGAIADGTPSDFKDCVLDNPKLFDNIKVDYVLTNNHKTLGYQLSIHTLYGLNCLSNIRCDIIDYKEEG